MTDSRVAWSSIAAFTAEVQQTVVTFCSIIIKQINNHEFHNIQVQSNVKLTMSIAA